MIECLIRNLYYYIRPFEINIKYFKTGADTGGGQDLSRAIPPPSE